MPAYLLLSPGKLQTLLTNLLHCWEKVNYTEAVTMATVYKLGYCFPLRWFQGNSIPYPMLSILGYWFYPCVHFILLLFLLYERLYFYDFTYFFVLIYFRYHVNINFIFFFIILDLNFPSIHIHSYINYFQLPSSHFSPSISLSFLPSFPHLRLRLCLRLHLPVSWPWLAWVCCTYTLKARFIFLREPSDRGEWLWVLRGGVEDWGFSLL